MSRRSERKGIFHGLMAALRVAACLMVIDGLPSAAFEPPTASETQAGPAVHRSSNTIAHSVQLKDSQLLESSGLAFSHRSAQRVWTHNDSGGQPEIFAFDLQGNCTAKFHLGRGLRMFDWEDIDCFTQDGQPRMLIADVGDNWTRRNRVRLFLLSEPDPNSAATGDSMMITDYQTLAIQYPDSATDCEAVTVNVAEGKIWLFSKNLLPTCTMWSIDLPRPDDKRRLIETTADPVTVFDQPLVTGADYHEATRQLVLCNYFIASVYSMEDGKVGPQTFRIAPTPIRLPALKQIEGIAVDRQSCVWVTSEGSPAILEKVKCLKSNKSTESISPTN